MFHTSTRGEQFQGLTNKMAHLSWKMLSIVPPMVSTDISDAPFDKEWHDKEIEPDWNESLLEPDYNLVYYRPILFFSYEGKVTQKGWVGNHALEENEEDMKEYKPGKVCTGKEEIKHKEACAQNIKTRGGEKRGRTKRFYKSYKKPTLKITDIDSWFIPPSIPDIDSESNQARDIHGGHFDIENEDHKKKEVDSTALYGLKKFHV